MAFDEVTRRRTAADEENGSLGPIGSPDLVQLQTLLDSLSIPIGYRDHTLTVLAANRLFTDLMGIAGRAFDIPDDVLSRAAIDLRPEPQSTEDISAALAGLGPDISIEHVSDRRADGSVAGFYTIISDHSGEREMLRLAAEMHYRDTHDSLTGLANRADFETRIERALESARERDARHALLYIDLDQFQLVNEACGHTAGDAFLREAASLIQSCIRSRDSLARLGGDEFGIILEHCDMADAREVADKICKRMAEYRFSFEQRKFRIGASIGLVPIDASWEDAVKLLKAADTACYAAKEAGRDRVVAYFDVDGSVEARRSEAAWVHLLDQAMTENHFTLYAQLIEPLQAEGGGLCCEILLRLKDRDGQLINPGEFLPAAERFRIMPRVDRWVVGSVIDFLASNRDLVADAEMISVNLSGKSIGDRNFQNFVQERITSADFAREKLCFEITESESINNMDSSVAFIEKMRKIGIRFSLDDFGTGVSSFSYLKKLPVDFIKIDGQFVENMAKDPVDYATVRSIQDVAKLLGKQTIAEFVADAEVEEQLRDLGVDFMQGYLRHRPMPLESVFAVAGSC